jgi:hypothetical protein
MHVTCAAWDGVYITNSAENLGFSENKNHEWLAKNASHEQK